MASFDSISELVLRGAHSTVARRSEIECAVLDLFEKFRNPLLRYTLSFGLSIHDAEEVTQEVFLALFQHLRLGRPRNNLRGWIFRVAHNLALKQRLANKTSLHRTGPDENAIEEHHDPSPNPEEHLASAQRGLRLQAVVDAFPEPDRNCLMLRAEGLRYREIASVLGISLGAVSISLTRSIARLSRADGRLWHVDR